jgi:2-polyprenyl-3-methyl-5-hydroxy-6-metoxy-1,4-benzoquinol methylase
MSNPTRNPARLETLPCDICHSTEARLLFVATDRLHISEEPWQIAECLGCGVLRTLPVMREDELAKFYPDEYWGGVPTERWIAASQADKTAFVRACQLTGGSILDVGCGAGFFLRALKEGSWQKFGVEIGEEAARAAKRLLMNGQIFHGTLSEAAFADHSFDVVTFWSSLEHTNEPRQTLIEARRIIKPGGTVIVQVPNAASYQAELFKSGWFALDAPRHRYHFTPESLQRVLQEAGFGIYQTTFHSKAHNSHALRQSLKFKLWQRSPLHRAAFLLAIPFIKPFDYVMSSSEKGATMTVAAHAL